MAEFTDFMANKIIDQMRNVAGVQVAVYVALFTTATADDGSGTEVSGGSYARKLVGLGAPAGGGSSNLGTITFTTATTNWGTITHCALYDAVTSGNMLMHSILDASKAVNNGDTFKINVGQLDVTVQ